MNRRVYLILSFVLVLVPATANETKYGAIEIRSTPEGAPDYIEGFFSGSMPASVPDVPEGSYRVVVKSEMHGNYVEDIVVEKLKTRSGRAI